MAVINEMSSSSTGNLCTASTSSFPFTDLTIESASSGPSVSVSASSGKPTGCSSTCAAAICTVKPDSSNKQESASSQRRKKRNKQAKAVLAARSGSGASNSSLSASDDIGNSLSLLTLARDVSADGKWYYGKARVMGFMSHGVSSVVVCVLSLHQAYVTHHAFLFLLTSPSCG